MGIEYLSTTRNQREAVIAFLKTLGCFNIIQARILYMPLSKERGYNIKVEFYKR
jgi:hypothetical protein